jgi:FAD/FMN-containing dehydrogenase
MLPQSTEQLAELMAVNNRRGEKIPAVELGSMTRVLEFTPEDMTVTVEAGISLERLQQALIQHRQWLPIDPPRAERTSIHDILSMNLCGPRRFGYGMIRDHLIGMKAVLADGRVIKSGGKVVKNVAGYDLAKLFIGARDTLGIIVEATFKVRPLPETEQILFLEAEPAQTGEILRAVRESDATPVIVDLHRSPQRTGLSIVLGLAGTRAEVDWQLGVARGLGFTQGATLEYERAFWSGSAPVNHLSVLPARVVERVHELRDAPFVARAGNGVIYFRGPKHVNRSNLPLNLMQRVKDTFDPKNVLPEFTP